LSFYYQQSEAKMQYHEMVNQHIPSSNINAFEKQLSLFDQELLKNGTDNSNAVDICERIAGTCIFHEQWFMLTKLNALMDEHNVNINKMNVMENICYAQNRENSRKHRNCEISFNSFENRKWDFVDKYYNKVCC